MLNLQELSFCSSNFDRAAHLRKEKTSHKLDSIGKTLILWRGKPLIDENNLNLVFLPLNHEILSQSQTSRIFLGQSKGTDYFAHDISDWEPSSLEPANPSSFLDDSTQHHPSLQKHQRFNDLRLIMTQLPAEDAGLVSTAKALFSWHKSHQFCAKCGHKSVSSQAGWQRDCSTCGSPHYPRTDPVVIMLITDGNNLLLGRSPHWPEKMYSCLAGFIEPGETLEAAVAREVKEETNIEIGSVRYVMSQPWAFPTSLMLGCIASATSHQITIDPIELDDAIWVSKETLVKAYSGIDVGILPARQGAIAEFLIRNWVKGTLVNECQTKRDGL